MPENRKSLSEKLGPNLISQIEPSELFDICVNKGILHEANSTFFNPLGYVLRLDDVGNCLRLDKSEREEGPVLSMMDRMAITAFRNFSAPRHEARQRFWGFIIQTADILRSEAITEPAATTSAVRLRTLLNAVDQLAYLAKQKMMRYSKDKDESLNPLVEEEQMGHLFEAVEEEDYASVVNYAAILFAFSTINEQINKLEYSSRRHRKEEAEAKFAEELGVDLSIPENRNPSKGRNRK